MLALTSISVVATVLSGIATHINRCYACAAGLAHVRGRATCTAAPADRNGWSSMVLSRYLLPSAHTVNMERHRAANDEVRDPAAA